MAFLSQYDHRYQGRKDNDCVLRPLVVKHGGLSSKPPVEVVSWSLDATCDQRCGTCSRIDGEEDHAPWLANFYEGAQEFIHLYG